MKSLNQIKRSTLNYGQQIQIIVLRECSGLLVSIPACHVDDPGSIPGLPHYSIWALAVKCMNLIELG